MNKRDTVRPKLERPRGILHVRPETAASGLRRYLPTAELESFVEHYWIVEWNVTEPVVRETLPHPAVHLVFEAGEALVHGVGTSRFTRVVEGTGRVVGVKFRPGGFRPFVDRPVSTLTNRRLAASEALGLRLVDLGREVCARPEDGAAIGAIEDELRSRRPELDEAGRLACTIAEHVARDRAVVRVEQIVRQFDIGARRLQRLFGEYVGVGPKWVIQRARLHEAVEQIAARERVDWADLAAELGYADQAHLIRDFKRIVGRAPAAYQRALE